MVPAFFLLLSFFSSIVDSLRSSRFSYGSHVITLYIALITVASFNHCFRVVFIGFRLDDGMAGEYRSLKTNIGLEKAVTLKQLKDATRNFGHENEIGRGGFGTVYKAELEGRTVAVKRLSSHSEERINSKLRLQLDWKAIARCKICLGIARGLQYLHKHRLQTIHRDIKAANILLDGKLEAKISDFGLASLYTEDNQFEFIKVEVSQGYIAPENVRGIVTFKTDVYSFGLVLHETVSGKTNAGTKRDSLESGFSYTVKEKEARSALLCFLPSFVLLLYESLSFTWKRRLLDLVDRNLSGSYDAKEAVIILNLAVKCTSIAPAVRPTMSDVVSVLVGDKRIDQI
ncbi:probable LRR receptor-like serine/threonine-protein kinase At1g53440 [Rosa chinensis]|uniref:probable LRR receptor-like serine/threonine-protein kinase At1g53440 n=1 Tax=Rosa chinensis TaxID=74649 RepID=UPI001AD923CE|nr:probable LRR receptor-like serine/threonine-protein kinase At1g53440 [Rosa chinensis]